jgi:hypothetical protein
MSEWFHSRRLAILCPPIDIDHGQTIGIDECPIGMLVYGEEVFDGLRDNPIIIVIFFRATSCTIESSCVLGSEDLTWGF